MSSPPRTSSGSEPQSAQPESAPDKSGIDAATNVEIQNRFNELEHKFLDHRVKLVDWWLAAMAGFLTFFSVVAVIVGYLSFQRFEDIETRAEGYAKDAEDLLGQIEEIHGHARSHLESMTAETVHDEPDKASEVVETVQKSLVASPIDQAIATAFQLQGQEKIEAAREMWRYIARVTEGVDRQLQARAWFSVGYLYGEEDNWEAAIDAYDKALELDPNDTAAYNNRGVAKRNLGQYEAALADYDKALELEPDMAAAYNNRGYAEGRP